MDLASTRDRFFRHLARIGPVTHVEDHEPGWDLLTLGSESVLVRFFETGLNLRLRSKDQTEFYLIPKASRGVEAVRSFRVAMVQEAEAWAKRFAHLKEARLRAEARAAAEKMAAEVRAALVRSMRDAERAAGVSPYAIRELTPETRTVTLFLGDDFTPERYGAILTTLVEQGLLPRRTERAPVTP